MLLQRGIVTIKREDQILQRGDKHYKVGHDICQMSVICPAQHV